MPELSLEEYAQAPHPDTLGGPYGNGRVHPSPKLRPTPFAPARIDETMSDRVLVDYLNRLMFEMRRDRTDFALLDCTETSGTPCPTGAGIPVFIQPEIGMTRIDPDTISANGVVVARIINFDTRGRRERHIGFPAAARTYWYVYRDGTGLKSRFFTRTHDASGAAVTLLGTPIRFRRCPGHQDVVELAVARWADCHTKHGYASTAAVTGHSLAFARRTVIGAAFTTVRPREQLRRAVATETWVKCMATCCSD